MSRKIYLSILITFLCVSTAFAGGILTNTNQTARFARLLCLDASTSIDAAYSNPAGLVMLKDGFHFSFSNQSVYQTRNIRSEFAPLAGNPEGNGWKKYKGEASAPIVPSLQAAYKNGPWVISANLAVSGGGGKATFNRGLPMFEAPIATLPLLITQAGQALPPIPGIGLSAQGYSVDQFMEGSSFIYGAQLGASYQINEHFSLYGGFRLNIVNNSYEGHLRNLKVGITSSGLTGLGLPISDNDGSLTDPSGFLDYAIANASSEAQKASLGLLKKATTETGARLKNKQSGWGVSPIIGLNYNYEKLNIGVKYEFRTGLNVENKTKIDDTGMFTDGVNTPHDIPGLLTVGVSYQITPKLMATVGYHHFFDSEADMDRGKQKYVSGGTDEYLFGAEYQIDPIFLISAGGQITRYGVKDEFQNDLSFSINSYSIGFGGAANVSKNVKINIGYFWTTYSDWKINYSNYNNTGLAGTNIYSRTNKVFAAGVDFSF
ncbi:OmpP1/FadL family transporter [Dysgonomonas sp. 25]|uniref:OmpP1/FadL family transporter n=1 Tax=Dysgonomonas sp. 25 TaxID=2302933 RepID=UPI0013CF4C01|nr:aromatic hydrocarbon degradation protein [Dysgonomonas sp. 25]NDV69329.1 aromatic hydrocarbon degradation protein [Dysgonomonas sp. 25]